MADLKFGSVTPALGKIKVGGDDVSKIYQGSDQVWPSELGSYLLQICGSTQTMRVTAAKYWDTSVAPAVLIYIPDIIPDNTVLKISDNNAIKAPICVEILSYDASIEFTSNWYFVSTPTYSSCEECSPTPISPSPTPIGPSPGPQPSTYFLVQMCATGEEFFVDSSLGYSGTTPANVNSYQLQINDVLLVKNNQFDTNPKCARIISTSVSGNAQKYFDFINPAGPGCPGDPAATCID